MKLSLNLRCTVGTFICLRHTNLKLRNHWQFVLKLVTFSKSGWQMTYKGWLTNSHIFFILWSVQWDNCMSVWSKNKNHHHHQQTSTLLMCGLLVSVWSVEVLTQLWNIWAAQPPIFLQAVCSSINLMATEHRTRATTAGGLCHYFVIALLGISAQPTVFWLNHHMEDLTCKSKNVQKCIFASKIKSPPSVNLKDWKWSAFLKK